MKTAEDSKKTVFFIAWLVAVMGATMAFGPGGLLMAIAIPFMIGCWK